MPLLTRHRRAVILLPLLILLGLYTVTYLVTAQGQAAVTMVDYWTHLQWARELSLSRLDTWVHPFYPVGYFALLRVGLASGADVARYGQFLSWAGSIGCLVAVYLFLQATAGAWPALVGVAVLGLHPFFRFQALQEGTDMLAAGLQLLALATTFVVLPGDRRRVLVTSAAAGALLGAAYLIRYTTLTLLPVMLLYLWWRDRADRRTMLASLALFLGLFGLVALPQIAAGAVVTGSPFYNEQARNVWFGLYGNFNWTDNWRAIPPDVTLAGIVRDDPATFLNHWAREFGRFFAYDGAAYAADPLALERKVTLWEPWPLHLVWLAGAFLLVFDKRLTRPQIFLLLAGLFVPVIVTSMAWLFTRYLLVPLAIQVVLVVLAAGQLAGRLARTDRASQGLSLAFLIAFALLFRLGTTWDVKQQRTHEIVRRVEEAQPLLEAMGVARPAELMSNNRLYQILDEPEHPQYLLFQAASAETSVQMFLQQIVGPHRPDLLLFDWTPHAIRTIAVEPYRAALTTARDRLAPLQLTDDYALYCVLPCRADEATPVDQALTPELTLVGYRAFTGGEQQGIYLYWMLKSPVTGTYPLALTLRDESGNVLFQTTGDPQQGTYPLDRWKVGDVVPDFYLLSADILPDRTYFLTIAPEGTETADPSSNHDAITVPIRFSAPAA